MIHPQLQKYKFQRVFLLYSLALDDAFKVIQGVLLLGKGQTVVPLVLPGCGRSNVSLGTSGAVSAGHL